MREREEPARFLCHVLEVDEAERLADDIEEIAVFACGRVSLMFNCT